MDNQPATPESPLIPLPSIARQLGYSDIRHFRRSVAEKIGLRVIQVGSRWFVAKDELETWYASRKNGPVTGSPERDVR